MTRYSVILGNLGNTCDRFLSSGYKDQPPKAEMIRQAAAIPGVTGVELVGTWDVTKDNVDEVGGLLAKHGLSCVSIIPDHFSQKRWGPMWPRAGTSSVLTAVRPMARPTVCARVR